MGVDDLQQVWEGWAQADPLWAILSDPTKRQGGWDLSEFFATGREEIRAVMADLGARGIDHGHQRCLDFGCGVGRLTQALADYFDIVDGVDISPTMIRRANDLNDKARRCQFQVNSTPNLELFEEGSFDFVYSNIVLQHIRPELAEIYIGEFVRVLRHRGIAVFQVPSEYRGRSNAGLLPAGAHKGLINFAGRLTTVEPGTSWRLQAEVQNQSDHPWPGFCNLALGNHWLTGSSLEVKTLDDGRTPLGRTVAPGETIPLELAVTAPTEPGHYLLELDLVEEAVCWFAERESPTLRIPVDVTRPSKISRVLRRSRSKGISQVAISPPPFEMHGIPRERVVALIENAGGEMLDIESYNPAGEGWDSYRYYVAATNR